MNLNFFLQQTPGLDPTRGKSSNHLIIWYKRRNKHQLIKKFHIQGSHRFEKYLNIQDCLEESLKIEFALKSTWKTLKGLEQEDSTVFVET